MATSIEDTISDHLLAWNSPAGAERDALVSKLYAADVTIGEPDASYTGHAGMVEAISGLQAAIPGTAITRSGPIQTAQELSTYSWNLGPTGGPVIVTGRDVVTIENGTITALYVIIDAPAE